LLGIFCAYLFGKGEDGWTAVVLVAIVYAALLSVAAGKRRNIILTVGLLLVVFLLGALRFGLEIRAFERCGNYDGTYTVSGTIDELCVYKERGVAHVYLENVRIDGKKEKGKIFLFESADDVVELSLSDRVVTTARLTTKTDAFSDKKILIAVSSDVRFYASSVEKIETVGREFSLFRAIRQGLKNAFDRGMSETNAGIAYGLLVGDTSGIEEELLQNVRFGGVAHIFAVSGLHVGALYACLQMLSKKTKFKRLHPFLRLLILSFSVFFYSGVCGFSASSLRAAVMCTILCFNDVYGYKGDSLESLGLAAIVVLTVCPTFLFEIGFQLSFVAVFGIAMFSKGIFLVLMKPVWYLGKKWLRTLPEDELYTAPDLSIESHANIEVKEHIPIRICKQIASFLAASISAQIATAPLQLNMFGYLPKYGFLLNCAFVPIVSSVYTFVLFAGLFATLIPVLSTILLYPIDVIFSAIILPLELFSFADVLFAGVKVPLSALFAYALAFLIFSEKFVVPKSCRWLVFFAVLFIFLHTMYALNGSILRYLRV